MKKLIFICMLLVTAMASAQTEQSDPYYPIWVGILSAVAIGAVLYLLPYDREFNSTSFFPEIKSIAHLAEVIKSQNELFNAMLPSQKRVMIAKDLLARLNLNQLHTTTGAPIRLGKIMQLNWSESVKKILDTSTEPVCEVCAKGGLFMAYIGRVNNETVDDLIDDVRSTNSIRGGLNTKLAEIFGVKQLAYIEFAYEGRQYLLRDADDNDIVFTREETNAALDFWRDNTSSFTRLKLIAQNIIDNNGTFKL